MFDLNQTVSVPVLLTVGTYGTYLRYRTYGRYLSMHKKYDAAY